MLKANLYTLLNILLLIGAGSSSAGTTEATPAITWDQFKESCLHPEKFHSQLPPTHIQVQCTDIQRDFVPTKSGQVPLEANRKVIFAVLSDKYRVNASQAEVPVTAKGGNCMRYKEVERMFTVERKLCCDDVLDLKMSLQEYCVSLLDDTRGVNQKLVEVKDTGRVVDTCKALSAS